MNIQHSCIPFGETCYVDEAFTATGDPAMKSPSGSLIQSPFVPEQKSLEQTDLLIPESAVFRTEKNQKNPVIF